MNIKNFIVGAVALATALALSACGDDENTGSTTASQDAERLRRTPKATSLRTTSRKPWVFSPMLGIEHPEPVCTEAQLSGAKAVFDLTVNSFDVGINIYADQQTMDAWQEASDALGGIHLVKGMTVLSLNSSQGIADSAEIAPAHRRLHRRYCSRGLMALRLSECVASVKPSG